MQTRSLDVDLNITTREELDGVSKYFELNDNDVIAALGNKHCISSRKLSKMRREILDKKRKVRAAARVKI